MRPPNATSRWTTGPKWSSYRRMDMLVARTRRPAVAGDFYAEEPAELAAEVAGGRGPPPPPCSVTGPSHTNAGLRWRLMTNGAYRPPLGDVPVDEALAQAW